MKTYIPELDLTVLDRLRDYATDLTDPQWQLLALLLPAAKPSGRPRKVDLREVMNTLLYLDRRGCQWDILPPQKELLLRCGLKRRRGNFDISANAGWGEISANFVNTHPHVSYYAGINGRDGNRAYRENIVNSGFSELYAYDGLNQLTSMDRGTLNGTKTGLTGAASRSQAWNFDSLGNFDSVTTNGSTETRSHNKQNEITSISGATTPTYDANGNLTTDETGRTLKYDGWNRLKEVKTSGGSTIVTYKYDSLTHRVSETKGSDTRDFYYSSNWQVLEERLNGTTDTRYVWSPVYVDAMILRDRDTDGNGSLDERLYAIQDANWNVTALVNTSGVVVERNAYDSFGLATVHHYSASKISIRADSVFVWIVPRWHFVLDGTG